MTLESNKKTATEVLFASESGDAAVIRSHTTEDFTFQFMDSSATWVADGKEVSTLLDKENYIKFGITAVGQVTQDGMHFNVSDTIAEGDYVVIFGTSNAKSKSGKKYANNYCWRFIFRGDKVREFREYCDTKHAYEVLFD